MNHATNLAGMLLSAAILAGCTSTGGPGADAAASQETYNQAVKQAKIALTQAHKANNVWRDSGKLLQNAEKAAKSGDFQTATKLALKAKRQGELAVQQAESQKNAGPE